MHHPPPLRRQLLLQPILYHPQRLLLRDSLHLLPCHIRNVLITHLRCHVRLNLLLLWVNHPRPKKTKRQVSLYRSTERIPSVLRSQQAYRLDDA